MEQSRGNTQPTPWWYRVPPVAVTLVIYAVTGLVIFTLVSEAVTAWALGGLGRGLLASFA
ncbi:hypothetical protein [Streptomyces sp. NRRL F-5135]|uniref:hypothetical protein n=1 Tax=Streptomyces sp. NRRL F-5135 TaxID=1463858 RepID=UPI000B1ECBFA|nr:hypothetical protein [Streptomyces sp. NRRL F-5135]